MNEYGPANRSDVDQRCLPEMAVTREERRRGARRRARESRM